jgi:hypothetical protein
MARNGPASEPRQQCLGGSTATLRKASSPAAAQQQPQAPSHKPQAVSTDNLRLGAPSTSSSSTCLPEAAAVRRSSLSDSPSPHLSILRSQLPPEPLINQRPVLAPEKQADQIRRIAVLCGRANRSTRSGRVSKKSTSSSHFLLLQRSMRHRRLEGSSIEW